MRTTDSFEDKVAAADPAAIITLPDGTSAEAHWNFAAALQRNEARRRSTIHRKLFVSIPLVAASALVLSLVFVIGGSPPSAASQLLNRAASRVALISAIPSGQFDYQETQSTYQATLYSGYSPAGPHGELTNIATAQYQETDQTWMSSDGSTKVVRKIGPLTFPSPAVQAKWESDPTGASSLQHIQQANQERMQSAGGQSALNVSDLPTDQATLESIIANGELQTNIDLIPSGPNSTFERSAALLLGPTQGMSPELASALFNVLAAQPGILLVGHTADQRGRQGQGVELKNADGTAVSEVIVDPANGSVLEVHFASPQSTLQIGRHGSVCDLGPVDSPYPTPICRSGIGQVVTAPISTDIDASGIVSSDSATTATTG